MTLEELHKEIKQLRPIVASVFPACGEDYCQRTYGSIFNIKKIYKDLFDWTDNPKTGKPMLNPLYPQNYIHQLKTTMHNYDVVFMDSERSVRFYMERCEIPFICVFPDIDRMEEWITRMKNLGYDSDTIAHVRDNWEELISLTNEACGLGILRLGPGEFVTVDKLVEFYKEKKGI